MDSRKGQEEAIKKTKGPCVVLAGAGTGKTYMIVEKIKYLISNKIYPSNKIVCITFSNEAANNLLNRVRKILIGNDEPIIRTFHGFSADLLRKYGDKIGINKEFNILTPDEAKVVLHRYFKVAAGDCHKYIRCIGTAKDLGIGLDSLREYLDMKMRDFGNSEFLEEKLEKLDFELKTLHLKKERWKKNEIVNEIIKIRNLLELRKFINVWGAYEKIKKIKNYQDYSDLNRNALFLLEKDDKIREDFDYIIVDEFQDTNKVQLDMLCLLARDGNVTVVGDLNQSIYRFRGAYKKNFYEFRRRFDITKDNFFNLDRSFRSPNKVLRAAYHLILNNYSNLDECFEVLSYDNREGENIEVYELRNGREEAWKIADLIEREIDRGVEMREICVMFRTHQQGRIIRKILGERGIPFVAVDKASLLKEKSIRIVIDYLTILKKLKEHEKGGDNSWWDLCYNLDFSEEDLIKIGKFIKDNKEVENLNAVMLNSLPEIGLSDSGRMKAKIMIEKFKLLLGELNKPVEEFIRAIYNISGVINQQKTKEEKIVMMNLNRFYELAKEHSALYGDDVVGFVHYLNILDSLGIELASVDFEENGIRLMTLHATKGLEYKTVIITNFAHKRFPIEKINNSLIPAELSPEFDFPDGISDKDIDYYVYEYERQNQLFEERRLCYVAFTRAKEKLILTYANEYGGRKYYPSRFLLDIKYKDNPDLSYFLDLEERYEEPEAINDMQIIRVEKENSIKELTFSPSALLMFVDCQKKYEYRYVYNMPEQKTISWEAIMLGSFVHMVLEAGVKGCFRTLKEFEDLVKEIYIKDDWEIVNLTDALQLIRVFFARNHEKYNTNSKTEQLLKTQIGGLNFVGFADRIDFNSYGIEIIDYKTGKSVVPFLARNWQLGYYALAASSLGLGRVRKITLDMLRHEKPLEFELDDVGNAYAVNSSRMGGFNIFAVEEELIKTAHEILNCYEKGFKACAVEKNCEFCNEWIYRN